MRKAARRLKPVRWVAEVASKADKSQSRFLPCPKSEGVRHCRRAWPPSLAVGEISTEGRQTVTLELRSIRLEPHAELAAQSLRKIPHRGFKLRIKTNHNWTTKAGSPAAF